MSLKNFFSENKALSAAIAAVGFGGAIFWAYKVYKEEQSPQEEQVIEQGGQPAFNIEEEIRKLKEEINAADPTLGDVKKILSLLTNYVKSKTMAFNNKFKAERRKKFPHEKRYSQMAEYFRFSNEGLNNLQTTIMELQKEQTQLMSSVGISQAAIARHGAHLGAFMQELVFDTSVSVDDVKRSIALKTDYLSTHGQRLIDSLIQASSEFSLREKQNIMLFLNVVISDEAFQKEPSLDKDELDMAYEKYKDQINPELMKLESVLMPLMGQLQSALVGEAGMGGMGGMGMMGGEDMGMGGMGGMGGEGGFSEEMMMQQLQQLRMSDPQAYEQLMAMMAAQQGGR